ncbi:MAG TPA: UDP-galactopyranose mutase [Candidatus Binatia bacterium]|nr:UDP-galactopyranose mutase [Candidatus Binatia bacterium]
MNAFARKRAVIFWEEPLFESERTTPSLHIDQCERTRVTIVTPLLPKGQDAQTQQKTLHTLLTLYAGQGRRWIRWYYTPMMLPFSRDLPAACTVYDCMDELANFRFAPPELTALESELFETADVVFTGGHSLYEAKRHRHHNIHPFPSSIDRAHFVKASTASDPTDQMALPHPRLGFYGVIDERMDINLLRQVAKMRPDWSFVMVGPVVKISPDELPKPPNIHYLGQKHYDELPAYLSGWDVALMPFAINDSTRFISPTKTPEYLAAGRPVVSTPIKDVIRHYGELEAVMIASNPDEFIAACKQALVLSKRVDWRAPVNALLSAQSWTATANSMEDHITRHLKQENADVLPFRPTRAKRSTPYDYLIVGAGFAGSVLAERLASQLGKRVIVIDKRDHIGGNAHDKLDDAGILMHQYGPHIFHTNSADIFAYLSEFTSWRPYEHRVHAVIGDKEAPIPINRTTLNTIYGLDLKSDEEAAAFLASRQENPAEIRTSEDVVVAAVGRDLYEKFFRGYTRKQWSLDPSELDKSVTARIPTRTNTDDRYFTDRFQYMPRDGYTAMFRNLLDQGNIDVELGVDFETARAKVRFDRLIYTGPIDAYFRYAYGKLPYRSINFRHETLSRPCFQSVGTVNYPSEDVPYTRITEYKHLTGQEHARTTITYEYPTAEGDPYYPIPRPENQAVYKRYEALADADKDALFVGRLACYRYYNMDQVVGQALAVFRRIHADANKQHKTWLSARVSNASSQEAASP